MRIRNDLNLTVHLRNMSMVVRGNKLQTNLYTDFVETKAPFDLMTSVVDIVMISSKTARLID